MYFDLSAMISSVREREPSIKGGIVTAAHYLAGLGPCLNDDTCAATFFDLGSVADWQKALKDSESKLVYRHPKMERLDLKENQKLLDGMKLGPTPGACLDFAFVLTTTDKDRDGDVLESKGGILDMAMPGLWQHIPLQPIGKLTGLLKQSDKKIVTTGAIMDFPLGRDAAQLVEFGALRISHGFRPLEFEPLEQSKDDAGKAGWHVKRFEIMEWSLVSIPSNQNAVVLALSRGKLHHPLVKGWAEMLRKSMPPMVTSGWDGAAADGRAPIMVTVNINGAKTKHADCGCGSSPCSCHGDDKGNQMGPNAGGDSADGDMETDLAKAIKSLDYKGDYGQAFLHKGEAHAWFTSSDGDDKDTIAKIQKCMEGVKGIKKVSVEAEAYPPKDKGWKMCHPKSMDWVTGKDYEPDATKGAVPFKATKMQDQGAAWDASAATARLQKWAGVDQKDPSDAAWAKFQQGFAWCDSANKATIGAYKFPHHDVVNGDLVVNFKACAAGMAALNGARGGTTIPKADQDKVRAHLKRHYAQFGVEAPEPKGNDMALTLALAEGASPLDLQGDVITNVAVKEVDGVPVEIALTTEKAGKVLSAANAKKIGKAMSQINKAKGAVKKGMGYMMSSNAKAMCSKALGHKAKAMAQLKAVFGQSPGTQANNPADSANGGGSSGKPTKPQGKPSKDDDDDDDKSFDVDDLAAKLLGGLMAGNELTSMAVAKGLKKHLSRQIKEAKNAELGILAEMLTE